MLSYTDRKKKPGRKRRGRNRTENRRPLKMEGTLKINMNKWAES